MTSNACSARSLCRATAAAVGCLTCLLMALPAEGDEATARYFDQLRRRQLFSLAEDACLDQLARDDLSPRRRSELVLELSRTFAEHAKYTVGDEQEDLWKRAAAILDDRLDKLPAGPLRPWLEVQRALIPAAQGEFLRWQADLFPYDDDLKLRGDGTLADAISRLQKLEESLEQKSRRPARRSPAARDEASISTRELRALLANVRYHLGITLLERARLLPDESADRAAMLVEAERWFKHLAGGIPGEEMTWNAEVLVAETARLRGNAPEAASLLDAIEKKQPPTEVLDRTAVVRVRLLLAGGRTADAAQFLIDYRRLRRALPGELGFLKVKTSAALWEIAEQQGDKELSAKLFKQVESHVERADVEVGGYWGYRCRLLLESARATRLYGRELTALMQQAEALYRNGRTDEAVQAYREAANAAEKSGRTELVVELAYTEGSIELHAGRFEQAGDVFGRLANEHPQSQRAAAAHLLRAYSLGRLYEKERTKSRRLVYTEALHVHRKRFATDPTAVEATWMLAVLEESRLQMTAALELYLEIPPDHARGPAAQVAVARCYEFVLLRLRELKQPVGDWESDATGKLAGIASTFPAEPQSLSREQAEVALRFARILLNRDRPDFDKADRLLERVFASRKGLDGREAPPVTSSPRRAKPQVDAQLAGWKPLVTSATQLRIVSLAGRGEFETARSLVADLSAAGPSDVLATLDGLMELAGRADDQTRRKLGELQLRTAIELHDRREKLSQADQRRLDRCLAQAYAAVGRPEQAAGIYESLLAHSPDDRKLIKRIAELLLDLGTRESVAKARNHWRKLESFEKPGSRDWLNARYSVALCSYSLEDYDDCRKLLAVTRLLYPELGGADLREKYDRLQARLDATQRK